MTLRQALRERRMARVFIYSALLWEWPEHVHSLLQDSVVLRCEYEASRGMFVYDVCDPKLDANELGRELPTLYVKTVGSLVCGGFLEFTSDAFSLV